MHLFLSLQENLIVVHPSILLIALMVPCLAVATCTDTCPQAGIRIGEGANPGPGMDTEHLKTGSYGHVFGQSLSLGELASKSVGNRSGSGGRRGSDWFGHSKKLRRVLYSWQQAAVLFL